MTQRAASARVGGDGRAGGEAQLGIVGAHLHGHVAADSVRAAYPADDKLHARLLKYSCA